MANTHTTLSSLFTAVANAIRSKNGSTQAIIADNFPTEIENLRTGFDYCNNRVTNIADYEFKNCEDLKSVDCYNLTSIGTGTFEGCSNLKSVILYDGVESVGENAFKGCDCIIYCKTDSIPDTWHENWNPDNCIVLFGEPVETWDISATENDNVTAELYSAGVDGYTLYITGDGDMKPMPFNDFTGVHQPWEEYRDKIISITIHDSVTSIGSYAFGKCSALTSITIPDSVTSIGWSAFNSCTGLTSITIPDSVTSIGHNVFQYCSSLASITIPDGVTSISNHAFFGCTGLTSVTIPNSVTRISDYAFYYCTSLTSVTIPNSVTRISDYAFSYCSSLTSVTYTGNVSQWNTISFDSSWNYNTGSYTIHCTDGDIAKS